MPFCPNCGREVVQGARFCANCGYDLSRGGSKRTCGTSAATPATTATSDSLWIPGAWQRSNYRSSAGIDSWFLRPFWDRAHLRGADHERHYVPCDWLCSYRPRICRYAIHLLWDPIPAHRLRRLDSSNTGCAQTGNPVQ